MNKYIYGLILGLVLLLNMSDLICGEKEQTEQEEMESASKNGNANKHRRGLSTAQVSDLEKLMATGKGKRGARSLPSSKQFDDAEIEILKVLNSLNNPDA